MSTERIFDHVLIIVFENEYHSYVHSNPYMKALAAQGADLANHFGNMHPSQTNYISSVAGELCNITFDWPPYPPLLSQRTIVDLLEEAPRPLRWKAYLEGNVRTLWRPDLKPSDFSVPFPVPASLWATTPEPFKSITQPPYPFAYWHNPFFAFENVIRNKARWEKLVDEAAFWRDLLHGDFPEFAWYSPNLWNDGHYIYGTCDEPGDRTPLVAQQAEWLKSFFESLRFPGPDSLLPPRTLVVVTYDEADFDADYTAHVGSSYDGPNQIYTVLLGDMVEPSVQVEGSNHYSLLKTIEKNFGLGSLEKNDRDSNWWQFLWGRAFRWQEPVETPIAATAVAAAALGEVLHVAYVVDGAVKTRTLEGERWSAEKHLADGAATALAMAAHEDGLVLIIKDADGSLGRLDHKARRGWSASPEHLVDGPVGAFAFAAVEFDGTAMLVYADDSGAIYSAALTAGVFGQGIAIGHDTDGDLALAVLGPSLYLIHKAVGSDEMNVVSYNTAPFNAVTIASNNGGPDNNTTRNAWSPTGHRVAFYSRGPALRTPNQDQPLLVPYSGGAPYATATLDGVVHVVHPQPGSTQVVTETFSLSGIMTPQYPVSWATQAKAGLRSTDPAIAPVRTAVAKRPKASIWENYFNNGTPAVNSGDPPLPAASAAAASPQTGEASQQLVSNGFGTLAEAGWSLQHPISGVSNHAAGGLAMARAGSRLVMLSQSGPGARLSLSVGAYMPVAPAKAKRKARAVKRPRRAGK